MALCSITFRRETHSSGIVLLFYSSEGSTWKLILGTSVYNESLILLSQVEE